MSASADPVQLLGLADHELQAEEHWETRAAKRKQEDDHHPIATKPPPTPSSEDSGDFLGIEAVGKGIWSFWGLLGCSAQTSSGGIRAESEEKFYDATSIDWAEVFCPSNGANRILQSEANIVFTYLRTPQKSDHAGSHPENSESTFLTGVSSSAKKGTKHVQCFASGHINTLDFENNTDVAIKELHASIAGLSHLVCLRLHNENLHGPIPLSIFASKLIHLEVLDLSNNHLEGELEAHAPLGKLEKLEVLNLAHNNLSGILPACLGDLTNLESLILNNNRFGGTLPSTLSKLKKLTYCDLKGNCFLPGMKAADAKSTLKGLLPEQAELFI